MYKNYKSIRPTSFPSKTSAWKTHEERKAKVSDIPPSDPCCSGYYAGSSMSCYTVSASLSGTAIPVVDMKHVLNGSYLQNMALPPDVVPYVSIYGQKVFLK